MSPRRLAAAGLWAAGLAAVAVALQWAGQGPLAAPPVTDPGRWAAWLDGREPVLAAFSLLRVAALGALWYLAAITVLGTVLRLAGAAWLVGAADRITIGPVRRMLAGSVSLGLAASGVMAVAAPALRLPVAAAQAPATVAAAKAPATVAAAQAPATVAAAQAPATVPAPTTPAGPATAGAPATSTPAAPAGPATAGAPATSALDTPATPAPSVPPATVTMHRLGPAPAPAPAPVTPAAQLPPVAPPAPADRWAVEPGQSFWSIAEDVLAARLGRPPTDAEIVPYWQRLIQANRSELAHRDNPDLIFPAQVFVVPPP